MTFNIERELVSEQIYQVDTVFANQVAVMLLAGGLGGPPEIWGQFMHTTLLLAPTDLTS